MQSSFTLQNAQIVTMDRNERYFARGMLIARGKRIEYVGESGSRESEGTVIDMSGKLLMPGLVNTHAHSASGLFRGIADDLFLMEWLENHMWPAERIQTAHTAYIAAALTHLEYLESGITTIADMWIFPDSTAKAAMEVGLRTFVCATVFSRSSTESEEPIRSAEDFVKRWKGREEETRVYPAYGPHAVYSCNQDTLAEVARLAKRDDVLVHTHISETRDENTNCFARLKLSPTRAMEEAGIFENRVLAAHCVYVDEEDLEIFKKHDASVSYNPVSNLKLCSGIAPLEAMFREGVRVSIGTDGPQSNNSLDILRDLKIGALIQKNRLQDPTFLPAKEALKIATIYGAAALGMENEIGSLEAGKRVDIIALGLDRANMLPMRSEDPETIYSQIIYSASGANVTDVFVDGERLLKDRVPVRVDKEGILRQAQEASLLWGRNAGMQGI